MEKIYTLLRGCSAILGLLAVGILVFGNGVPNTGLCVISALICLAIGGLAKPAIKQHAFIMKLDEATCRTISLEVGMQNAGLASGIAIQMGKVATVGLASAIAAPWMTISGSLLANWWRNKSLKEKN